MIKIEELYKATNSGLDIILAYYPAARECLGTPNKHFKRRANETDASACLKLFNTKDGDVYKVTDFGDQGTAMSPIDICMVEDGLRFNEALLKLAAAYGVKDELDRSVNKPDIRKREAKVEEIDGSRFFELETEIPAHHLATFAPIVKASDADGLHWHLAKSISYVKNREVVTKFSTDTYPIFMRECIIDVDAQGKENKFYKIYEPLNPDKQYRFSYTPNNVKPKRYINGLHELVKQWQSYNANEEAIFYADPKNEGKPYKERKLKEAFICSGERDALCVKAHGYLPLWFNSETYKVSADEIRTIYKYVEVLYNIPDIDDTGKRKGVELALQYIDIHTIWLPEWLQSYRDHRGGKRKDLRDFVELRSKKQDFNNLMQLAMPAKFWVTKQNEKSGKYSYDIDSSCLHYFLFLNGFCALSDKNIDDVQYIQIEGSIVRRVKPKDIRRFLFDFAEKRALPREIRNLLLNSPRLSNTALEHMQEVDIDFTNYTPTSQLFFFDGKCYEVSHKGVEEHHDVGSHYVWEENVLPHKVKLLPPMFSYAYDKGVEGNHIITFEINDVSSPFFGYVINSSRVHWRQELEYRLEEKSPEEADSYKAKHKFAIDGELLTPEEVEEQQHNLLSKLFTIGYMMHRYKSPSQAWAAYAMDNKIGDDGECNGRSGKSLLFRMLAYYLGNTDNISGRKTKLIEDNHLFQRVTQHTNMILIDDCNKYLDTGLFYDSITSDMTVNPKNVASYNIPFELSPKLAFTTNYVPREFDPSSEGRLLYLVFSDYYHQKAEGNDYIDTRKVFDDFGKNLQRDYNADEWNSDINFIFQCVQFYLTMVRHGLKIQPPMDNIMKRKYKSDMGASFEDWAYVFFAPDGENVNRFVSKEDARNHFAYFANVKNYSSQRFTRSLTAFCELCPYVVELNPEVFRNAQGRIIRKDAMRKSVEQIYVRVDTGAPTTHEVEDPSLFE